MWLHTCLRLGNGGGQTGRWLEPKPVGAEMVPNGETDQNGVSYLGIIINMAVAGTCPL